MVTLKPVLCIKELPPAMSRLRHDLPSIRDYQSPEPRAFESELLTYLQQGVTCGLSMDRGLSFDVIDTSRRISEINHGGAKFGHGEVLTDGVWYWYAVLIYYVREYHLRVSSDFLTHASNMRWIVDQKNIDVRNMTWDDPIGKAEYATR